MKVTQTYIVEYEKSCDIDRLAVLFKCENNQFVLQYLSATSHGLNTVLNKITEKEAVAIVGEEILLDEKFYTQSGPITCPCLSPLDVVVSNTD
jgi:hypothetical protein